MPAPALPVPLRFALDTSTARTATTLLFAVNGIVLGGWGGVLPSLRGMLHLDPMRIGGLLFASSLAAIAAMQVGVRLSDRIGARRIAITALTVLVCGPIVLIFANRYWVAVVAALLMGLGSGGMDVSMNAIGVQVEQARSRPIMSSFHGFWSIGNLTGAATVLGVGTVLHPGESQVILLVMTTLAAISMIALIILLKITPQTPAVPHIRSGGRRVRIPRVAWRLGVLAICFGLSEGTAEDWSSIHVTVVAHVTPSTGAAGLVAFSACMVIVRLIGDRLVVTFGRRTIVRGGAVVAAGGYAITFFGHNLALILGGWALVGLGIGVIAPQVYAVAGHLGGGRVLAAVVTFGYAASLIGPAIMGFMVQHLGVQHAMFLPGMLCTGIIILAVTIPRRGVDLGNYTDAGTVKPTELSA